jgi:hypothetical protein
MKQTWREGGIEKWRSTAGRSAPSPRQLLCWLLACGPASSVWKKCFCAISVYIFSVLMRHRLAEGRLTAGLLKRIPRCLQNRGTQLVLNPPPVVTSTCDKSSCALPPTRAVIRTTTSTVPSQWLHTRRARQKASHRHACLGGRVGRLNLPRLLLNLGATSLSFTSAHCSNGIDARRAARRKVACEKRHRRKQYHNHDDRERIVGAHPVEARGKEVREAERERQSLNLARLIRRTYVRKRNLQRNLVMITTVDHVESTIRPNLV